MATGRRIFGYSVFFPVALVLSFVIGFVLRGSVPASSTPSVGGEYQVTRVLDGDTIEIIGGRRVRYAGIDAPELHERYGTAAFELNSTLVSGKTVSIEVSEEKSDLYGRTLAYVWLHDNTFVNQKLIEEGYATALAYNKMKKPKYYEVFAKKQIEARTSHRGMWVAEWK